MPIGQSEQQQKLFSVLDRQTTFDGLSALVLAMKLQEKTISITDTAICLDASVFLRIPTHARSVDIIDYISTRHSAPLILPGQAIQEFWNNHHYLIENKGITIKKQFAAIKLALLKIGESFTDYMEEVELLVGRFSAEFGHLYDEGTARQVIIFLEALSGRAVVSYAPRNMYRELADLRKRTKTPPGFKDEGHGDFFIWVDLLTGLQKSKTEGKQFERVVLVSLDQKADWTRSGRAHPILVAEVKALLDVPFEIWTIEQLCAEIDGVI